MKVYKCERCGREVDEENISTYRDFGQNGEQTYLDTDCRCGGQLQ